MGSQVAIKVTLEQPRSDEKSLDKAVLTNEISLVAVAKINSSTSVQKSTSLRGRVRERKQRTSVSEELNQRGRASIRSDHKLTCRGSTPIKRDSIGTLKSIPMFAIKEESEEEGEQDDSNLSDRSIEESVRVLQNDV